MINLLFLSEGPQSMTDGLEDRRSPLLSIALTTPTAPLFVYVALLKFIMMRF